MMSDSTVFSARVQAQVMWNQLFEELSECPICLDSPDDTLELRCHHVICEACAGRLKTDRNITCPFCKRRQRFGRAKLDQRSELFREAAQEKYRKLFDTGQYFCNIERELSESFTDIYEKKCIFIVHNVSKMYELYAEV